MHFLPSHSVIQNTPSSDCFVRTANRVEKEVFSLFEFASPNCVAGVPRSDYNFKCLLIQIDLELSILYATEF